MQTCTHENLTIINFGMGSANAATIMDLITAIDPKGVLFLERWWFKVLTVGHFVLPMAAVR